MRIPNFNSVGGALAALIVLTAAPVAVGGADHPPPYPSATQAYRQGVSDMKAGKTAAAVPALEYAAKRGVLGAQLKLARLYAAGCDVPKDDAKALYYYQQIADQYADLMPSSPIAKYIGEAFVAIGKYYADGIPSIPLAPAPAYAADLFRHAGSYYGSAEAQYQLGRLYLEGKGVEKNPNVAVNWLAMAARKQHAAAQAVLGELLWRGDQVHPRRGRGLALLILANENAKAGKDLDWIGPLYQEALAKSDDVVRAEAQLLLPQLGGPAQATASAMVKAVPAAPAAARVVVPTPSATTKPVPPPTKLSVSQEPLGPPDASTPAAIGVSVGFSSLGTVAH
jgi:TPR repeat protein